MVNVLAVTLPSTWYPWITFVSWHLTSWSLNLMVFFFNLVVNAKGLQHWRESIWMRQHIIWGHWHMWMIIVRTFLTNVANACNRMDHNTREGYNKTYAICLFGTDTLREKRIYYLNSPYIHAFSEPTWRGSIDELHWAVHTNVWGCM